MPVQPQSKPQQKDDSNFRSGECSSKEPAYRGHECSTPVRPKPLEDISVSMLNAVPQTPRKRCRAEQDHTYSIQESPRSVKRKLDKAYDKLSSMKRRLKTTQAKARRLKKRVVSLQEVVKTLKEKNYLTEQGLEMLEKTCDMPAEIMKRCVKSRSKDVTSKEKYSPSMRAFALTLSFYSAKAYRFVRKTFDLQLPHPSVIRKWYSTIDGKPGFTAEAFCTLERKAKEAKANGHELVCALMLDEMSIKKHIQWDGTRFHGYVDFGTECEDDTNPVATEALVFMVVPLNSNWKLPVGYFLIKSMTGVDRANLVQQCLSKLADIGILIESLTCDGPSCHVKMLETLGASMKVPDLVPSFPHPLNPDHRVSVFLDICHMLKLMRNALASNGILKDDEGKSIKWEYVKELHKLQEDEGLRLGNKVRSAHIQWQKQKMKVNIAAQTLSRSVADALEFLEEQGLRQFKGCSATARFIRKVDYLFDVLNSRNPLARNFKAPLRPQNEHLWRPFLTDAYTYLSSITDAHGKLMYLTPRKTPFLGFLIGIKSAIFMFDHLVAAESPKLKYLLTYKMSQDHLELFFCAMRSSLGANNNPTAREFTNSYRKMIIRHEIRGVGGNCTAQDSTTILHVSSHLNKVRDSSDTDDLHLIRKYDLSVRRPTATDHDYADIPNFSELSTYKMAVIPYIAGYTVRMVRRQLKCEECAEALTTGELMKGSFLEKKDRGGLVRPAPDVIKVCETAERCLQRLLKVTSGNLPQSHGLPHAFCSAVLEEVGHGSIFSSLSDHMFDSPADCNHVFLLVKGIAAAFLKIRMHHLAKQQTEKISGPVIRKQLSKLVLFKHQ